VGVGVGLIRLGRKLIEPPDVPDRVISGEHGVEGLEDRLEVGLVRRRKKAAKQFGNWGEQTDTPNGLLGYVVRPIEVRGDVDLSGRGAHRERPEWLVAIDIVALDSTRAKALGDSLGKLLSRNAVAGLGIVESGAEGRVS
jgi:hypothetical protein